MSKVGPKITPAPAWLKDSDYRHACRDARLYDSAAVLRSAVVEIKRRLNAQLPLVSDALIIGIGRHYDEAETFRKLLPNLKTLHIVEWAPEKFAALMRHFRKDIIDGRVRVHLADARQMDSLKDESVQLVYFSALLDLHIGGAGPWQIISESTRALKKNGHLISLDLTLFDDPSSRNLLQRFGLEEVSPTVLQKK